MASQSSYIKGSPPSLQPSAGGGCRAPLASPGSGGMRGPGRERSRALCPRPCDSVFLSDARILSPNSTQRFFGRISQFRAFGFPLSLLCACACSPLLLQQSVRGLCGFKGRELHQTLPKLLPDQYFLNELSVGSVTRQRLRQLLDLSGSKATRLFGNICNRPGCLCLCPYHEEELLTEAKFLACKMSTCESHSLPS